jgi:peptidoglycan hydrolase-like protein with peptidoglycan-binding domain
LSREGGSIALYKILVGFKFYQCEKLSSGAAMRVLSVALTIGLLSVAGEALALQKVGSNNSEVTNTQRCLKKLGYFRGPVTGKFAALTQKAVIGFQQANRLTADGVVGGNTQQALQRSCRTSKPSVNTAGELRLGSRSPAVSKLQQDLRQLRYFNGPNTGYFGTETQQAVIKFQQAYGIRADGIVSARTKQVMQSAFNVGGEYAVISPGSTGGTVTRLQERLSQLGYFNRSIDGYYGEYTRESVITFQRRYQLNPTGTVDRQTWQALELGGSSPVVNRPVNNRYVVVVPIQNGDTLNKVLRYVPNAFLDKSSLGSFVNAGAFSDRPAAESVSQMLRSNGLDARVQYF